MYDLVPPFSRREPEGPQSRMKDRIPCLRVMQSFLPPSDDFSRRDAEGARRAREEVPFFSSREPAFQVSTGKLSFLIL